MFVTPLGKVIGAIPIVPVVAVVTLSGGSVTRVGVNLVTASIIISGDGTIWGWGFPGGIQQFAAATDWIIPSDFADSSYEVRYINHTGEPIILANDFAIEGTWVDIGPWQSLAISTADQPFTAKTCTFDLQIRKDGGEVLATGSYSLSATRVL
jgi:hypothetical protein